MLWEDLGGGMGRWEAQQGGDICILRVDSHLVVQQKLTDIVNQLSFH